MATTLHLCIVLSAVVESLTYCSHGDVRLRGGTESAGRVEVCAHGIWGTICDRGWDHNDARVICDQLNLNNSVSAACGSACFGEGEGLVHYKDVQCFSHAQTLNDCELVGVGTKDCSNHTNDAGVICKNSNNDSTAIIQGMGAIMGVLLVLLAGVITGWIVTCYKCMSRNTMKEETCVHSHNEYRGGQFPKKNTTSNRVNYDDLEFQATSVTNPKLEYDVLRPA